LKDVGLGAGVWKIFPVMSKVDGSNRYKWVGSATKTQPVSKVAEEHLIRKAYGVT